MIALTLRIAPAAAALVRDLRPSAPRLPSRAPRAHAAAADGPHRSGPAHAGHGRARPTPLLTNRAPHLWRAHAPARAQCRRAPFVNSDPKEHPRCPSKPSSSAAARRASKPSAPSAARATRAKRLWRLGAAVAAAAVLAGGAIAVSSNGGAKPAPPATDLLAAGGIPENHGVLGDPKAPLTVTEYVDLQCPVCARARRARCRPLIRDEVRTGKVKLEVRTLSFLGADSVRAARVAAGAERQGRLWAFLEAFYARQGTENSGYVTDGFLRDVAKAAGVDAGQAIGQADSAFATGRLERADADAARMNVQGTPTLTVKRGKRARSAC